MLSIILNNSYPIWRSVLQTVPKTTNRDTIKWRYVAELCPKLHVHIHPYMYKLSE